MIHELFEEFTLDELLIFTNVSSSSHLFTRCYCNIMRLPYVFFFSAYEPPACSPACGTNAHCEYGIVNQCICNAGTSGNPYEGCGPQEKKSCSALACGPGAECREGISSAECSCPPGFKGNPYVQCEGQFLCEKCLRLKFIYFK